MTFDPIIESTNYVNKFFAEIPVPRAGTEIMLYASSSGKKLFITKTPGIRPRDIYKGKYDRKIVIDMRENVVSFRREYQSRDAGVNFDIEVKASVRVTDAELVWESDIHNVAQSLEREMNPRIMDEALLYGADDVSALRQDLRNSVGEMFLMGTGISVHGINYIVKLEEAHEKILKNKYLEASRSKAAKEISEMYSDEIVAVFAGVADGTLNPEEASRRARKSLSANFDERMRQMHKIMDFIEEARGRDLANKDQILDQMDRLMKSLSVVGLPEQSRIEANKTDEKREQSKYYEPIDE